jgi:uncharacterized membrane protein
MGQTATGGTETDDATATGRRTGGTARESVIPSRPEGGRMTGDDTPLTGAVATVVTATVLLVAFGLLALGYGWFWIAFPVGFGGVLPAAVALARHYERRSDEDGRRPDETADALATLRDRYARGEIDEEEFERRVDRLLRTEDVDDAADYLEDVRRERERELELERDRERRERERTR